MRPRLGLSSRERRMLTVGVFITFGTLVLTRGVPTWRNWHDAALASAAEQSGELARAVAASRDRAALRDTLAAREARFVALAPLLVPGTSPSSAAATLASLVSGAADAAGTRSGALQMRVDSAGAGVFTRIAVKTDIVGDIRGVMRLLAALERGPTMLAVRELSITQPEPGAPGDRAEVLRVELVVEGLTLNRATVRSGR